MAIVQVQTKTYSAVAGSTTHTITFNSTPTQGNLLILSVSADTVTTATPTGWSVGGTAIDSTGTYLYYKVAGASESASITITFNPSGVAAINGLEYSGLTATPLDKNVTATGQGSAGSLSAGTTAATTQADELLVAVAGIPSGTTTTVSSWSNSFVTQLDTAAGAGGHSRNVIATKTVAATGTQTTTATMSANQANSSAILATFKIAAGAAFLPNKPTVLRQAVNRASTY